MIVAIAADHAGLPLRQALTDVVSAEGHEPLLLGPSDGRPVDYPLVTRLVADVIATGHAERGILICGSGAGVTVAANKLPLIRAAYGKHDPAVLVLPRQNMPTLDRTRYAPAAGLTKGAYVLADAADGDPDLILMATGTEVGLVVAAYEQLAADGIRVRVVSMPSWELFERQPEEYRDSVLPRHVKARVAVEQAAAFGWHQYVGLDGEVIAMQTFGTSAPLKDVVNKFGFTPEHVVAAAKAQL